MNFSRREGPFVAKINGNLLSVHRCQTEEKWGAESGTLTGNGISTLFFCSLRQMPWFVVHSDGLYAQNAHDALTPLYRGEDAAQLLSCITGLVTTAAGKRRIWHAFGGCSLAVALGLLTWFAHVPQPARMAEGADLLSTVGVSPVSNAPAMTSSFKNGGRTDTPVLPQQLQQRPAPPAPPADGWDMPQSVRAELPGNLRKAAARGLFTVALSSGHARTIYVFADPACPNCQRMERHFETAAGVVNVVVFPVTIEGREASLKTLTPVMALPKADRPAAWKQLFAADAGIGVPGATQAAPVVTDEKKAETARAAIGVNEVAFRAYRLPGTPWTISDDGRYVPQSVLSSPAALIAFLNGGEHVGQ
ncbi:TrbB protein [Candidatus Pantoea floridensis]|uniref:TrbB protein n=1 Tax=Candidatus Pantoea floridensis TaxID=1938870 RepID=A0A286DSB7_9GAMM|nr:TrbB protein [Enterobacteriaceae bacterium JKS000233]SOD61545.1 TrbB protein [Pantoea floridensis]